MKEVRIEDIHKARVMAEEENSYRGAMLVHRSEGEDKKNLEKIANSIAEQAGEEYDKRATADIGNLQETDAREEQKVEVNLDSFYLRLENFTENLRRLARILQDRDSNRMSPLVSPDTIPRLKSLSSAIEDLQSRKNIEEIEEVMIRVIKVFEEMGRVSGGGPVRDNADSLASVIRAIRATHDGVLDMKQPNLNGRLPNIIKSLLAKTEESGLLLSKKRELLKRYEERRY